MSTPEARREIAQQVRAINGLHQKILTSCWAKCIPKPRDGELSIAEMACVDRCVPKYVETHELVGKEISTLRGAAVEYP